MTIRALLKLLGCLFLYANGAEAAELRVRADTRIAGVEVSGDKDWISVRAVLEDDAGRPMSGASVVTELVAGHDSAALFSSCEPTARTQYFGRAQEVITGAAGDFCLRVSSRLAANKLRLNYLGSDFVSATSVDVALVPKPGRLHLRFPSSVLELRLDKPRSPVSVLTSIEGSMADKARPLALQLYLNESGKLSELAETATQLESGSALFNVAAKDLGKPGTAQLVARFSGDAELGAGEARVQLQKSLAVELVLTNVSNAVELGDVIEVRATATALPEAIPSGAIEARFQETSLLVVPLQNATAMLHLDFASLPRNAATITLTYLPGDPWWIPGETVQLAMPVTTRLRAWSIIAWLGAFVAIAFFVLRAWYRPRARQYSSATMQGPQEPRVEIVKPQSRGNLSGQVLDAHDGSPIPFAMLSLTLAGFKDSTQSLMATTDARGKFTLDLPDSDFASATLVIKGPAHRSLRQPLSQRGELAVYLSSRRRALISELVKWARTLGPPWANAADPTPGQIANIAERHARAPVTAWARKVETAAFGENPPAEEDDIEATNLMPHPVKSPAGASSGKKPGGD